MPRPVCETLTARPSSVEGWNQWGLLSADGQSFTPLYGLESNLPEASALYYLAAAGICNVRGQYRLGDMAPEDLPQLAPVGNISAAQSVAVEEPAAIDSPGFDGWLLVIGGILAAMIFGAYFLRQKRQGEPSQKTTEYTFNQEK
jgi:hypothetical protein